MERNDEEVVHGFSEEWRVKSEGFTTFSGLLGVLVVFRTSQAYSRYWEGCGLLKMMTGCFFDAACSVMSFTAMSIADSERVTEFRQTIVALASLLHALCFCELAGMREESKLLLEIEVLGWDNFDEQTKSAVQRSQHKVQLAHHWFQCYVSEAVDSNVLNIPSPLLSRTFAELGGGVCHFEDACKLAYLPFPFHYTQTTFWLLIIHWLMTPLVVPRWTPRPSLAFLVSFVLIFVKWALYFISESLEVPFGEDPSGDIDIVGLQRRFNEGLWLLLSPQASHLAGFKEDRRGGNADMKGVATICLFPEASAILEEVEVNVVCPVEPWWRQCSSEPRDARVSEQQKVPTGKPQEMSRLRRASTSLLMEHPT